MGQTYLLDFQQTDDWKLSVRDSEMRRTAVMLPKGVITVVTALKYLGMVEKKNPVYVLNCLV